MKKSVLKFALSGLVLCTVVTLAVGWLNPILEAKVDNRYYILEKYMEELGESYEVQAYGSCHCYTSFDSLYFENTYGLTAYNMANAGEILPTTYLRMAERFESDRPKVALVEVWGLNPYETYDTTERIFSYYMPVNVERVPISLRKLEVIRDFESLSLLEDNIPLLKYKDRIGNGEITDMDFHENTQTAMELSVDWIGDEMQLRLINNGFKKNPSLLSDPNFSNDMTAAEYNELQAVVADDDVLEPEADIVKYVDKIIELCEQSDVALIFYRAPYISTENELRKSNWLAQHCAERGVLYIDTEKEIDFVAEEDFQDYYHLNESGAGKVTELLAPHILAAAQP